MSLQIHRADSPTPLSVSDILIVASVYLLSLLFVVGFPHPLAGFPLDDSWIHQVVARNLAQDGTLGFIPGVRSSGSTSLLWSILLAAKWKFLPTMHPVLYSDLLNALLLIVTGCGLLAMARKDGFSKTSCWIWALSPALSGNFIWIGTIGMEHVLFVALSVASIYLWFDSGRYSVVSCALCLGALSLSRPEGLVLTALIVLSSRWARRERRDILFVMLVVMVFVCVTFTANFITSHSWLPTTYTGRKWLYFGTEKVPNFTRVLFIIALFQNVLHPWVVLQRHPPYLYKAIVIVLIMIGLVDVFREHRRRIALLCIWSFVHIGIYAIMLPASSNAARYQPLYLALNFPLMFRGAEIVFRKISFGVRYRRTWDFFQTAALIAACVLCGFFSLRVWREVTKDGITVIESSHARMGELLIDKMPPQSKVAAFDIGRMGYLYGGSLVDLGGLTDNSFIPYLREHRLINYLEDRNIPFFVWPSNPDGSSNVPNIFVFTPESRRQMIAIASFCAPVKEYHLSDEATGLAAPCQTLYQLTSVR